MKKQLLQENRMMLLILLFLIVPLTGKVNVLIASTNKSEAKPQTTNTKPFVIPELKEWKGAKGTFTPSSTM
ncbi:hypothetical protein, partial [Bacteroides sp.]